jgi:cytoskeletal protein CcmA (bactofilin family)
MTEWNESGVSETIIASDILILGNLQGKTNVRLEGVLEGNIHVEGFVSVGESGRVRGDISAASVMVKGQVDGNIESTGKVHLGAKAKLKGNIKSCGLSIQEGAWFEGRISDALEETEPGRDSTTQYAEAPVYQ